MKKKYLLLMVIILFFTIPGTNIFSKGKKLVSKKISFREVKDDWKKGTINKEKQSIVVTAVNDMRHITVPINIKLLNNAEYLEIVVAIDNFKPAWGNKVCGFAINSIKLIPDNASSYIIEDWHWINKESFTDNKLIAKFNLGQFKKNTESMLTTISIYVAGNQEGKVIFSDFKIIYDKNKSSKYKKNKGVKLKSENIALNQVGFLKNEMNKTVIISIPEKTENALTYYIEEKKNNKWIKIDKLRTSKKPVLYNESGNYEFILDINDLAEGEYRVFIPAQDGIQEDVRSYDFFIKEKTGILYKELRNSSLSAFYYWFANAGGKFPEAHGQDENAVVMKYEKGILIPSGKNKDVRGGLYDAGDYGKYTVNGAISMGFIMTALEFSQKSFNYEVTVENKSFDTLDLIKREIKFLNSMQHENGGFHHKVATAKWSGMIMPENETAIRYVLPITTNATASGGASQAQAYRIFKNIDPAFAEKLLESAEKAWIYINNNTDKTIKDKYETDFENDGITEGEFSYGGPYGDDYYDDEKFWLAVELYGSTKKEEYKKYVMENLDKIGNLFLQGTSKTHDWKTVSFLGLYSLYNIAGKSEDKKLQEKLVKSYFIPWCEKLINIQKNQIYKYIIGGKNGKLAWGSNSVIITTAAELLLTSKITDDKNLKEKYFNSALKALNYITGQNPLGFSYISGIGDNSAKNPHWRYSVASNHMPAGFLVGGPNSTNAGGDPTLQSLQNVPQLRRYKDIGDNTGWAINEIAINWNSSLLVFMSLLVEE